MLFTAEIFTCVKTHISLVIHSNVAAEVNVDMMWYFSCDLTGKVRQSTHASAPQQQGQVEEAVGPGGSVEQTRPAGDPHPCLSDHRSQVRKVTLKRRRCERERGAITAEKPRRNVAGGLWK